MQNKAKITSEDLTKERLDKLKELLPELFSSDGNLNIQNLYDLANKYSVLGLSSFFLICL